MRELVYGVLESKLTLDYYIDQLLTDGIDSVRLPEPVSYTHLDVYKRQVKDMGEKKVEIVQSLAKWKRMALGKYNFKPGTGLYTDMNAIRLSLIHIYL